MIIIVVGVGSYPIRWWKGYKGKKCAFDLFISFIFHGNSP